MFSEVFVKNNREKNSKGNTACSEMSDAETGTDRTCSGASSRAVFTAEILYSTDLKLPAATPI